MSLKQEGYDQTQGDSAVSVRYDPDLNLLFLMAMDAETGKKLDLSKGTVHKLTLEEFEKAPLFEITGSLILESGRPEELEYHPVSGDEVYYPLQSAWNE